MSNCSSARVLSRLSLALAAWVVPLLMPTSEAAPPQDSDVAAIRAAIDVYVAAYNRGDAQAVAACWGEKAEWVSPTGEKFQGRAAIEKELQSLFAANPGQRIEVLNPSIRLLSADVALEEGTVRVLYPGEAPSDSTYLAVHVKHAGHWKLDTVRETEVPETPAPASKLQDLAWLVGQWVDADPKLDVQTTVTWTKNHSFLTYAFRISAPGADDLEGTQVIGWDPAAGAIRSWMFDSDGGFGEGTWSKQGDTWVVKFSQVLPDGGKATAVNSYQPLGEHAFVWKSTDRMLNGQPLPNIHAVKMVRKPGP